MRNAWIWIVIIVLVFGGALMWWQNSQPRASVPTQIPSENSTESGMVPEAMPDASSVAPTGATAAATVKEIIVSNEGFSFNPKSIDVKKGETVRISYTNGGGTHDFRIEGYDVGTKKLAAGQSETFEFVADKAGTFEFYCSVGNHRAMGMKGMLTVTE